MTDTMTEPGGGRLSPDELVTRLSAAGLTPRTPLGADELAEIRERAAAVLSPDEMAATRRGIRNDMRRRGISPQVRNDALRAVFGNDEPAEPGG